MHFIYRIVLGAVSPVGMMAPDSPGFFYILNLATLAKGSEVCVQACSLLL
jgi:hypothetical protein